MTCFMCQHDKFRIEWESVNSDIQKDNESLVAPNNIAYPTYAYCQRCNTFIWNDRSGWATGDMEVMWKWNGERIVLRDIQNPEEDLAAELTKLGKDKLKLILEALQKEGEDIRNKKEAIGDQVYTANQHQQDC